jgi:hypothetical protein
MAVASVALASLTTEKPSIAVPGFKLQLDEESYLTDNHGVFNPKQIINTPIGRSIKIYRTDGFCYSGKITDIEESSDTYKIYGTVNNVKDSGFGFVLAKGGIFAGAVVEKSSSKTYTLEFSDVHKGFVLMLSSKYNKLGA